MCAYVVGRNVENDEFLYCKKRNLLFSPFRTKKYCNLNFLSCCLFADDLGSTGWPWEVPNVMLARVIYPNNHPKVKNVINAFEYFTSFLIKGN